MRFIISFVFTIGQTLYAVIRNAATGQVWNTTLTVAGYVNANVIGIATPALAIITSGSQSYSAIYFNTNCP